MKRYRLIYRGIRSTYYCFDTHTSKRESLGTGNKDEAQRLIDAKNEAVRHEGMNLQIAQVYLQHSDPSLASRTWQDVFEKIVLTKNVGPSQDRWKCAIRDKFFDPLRHRKLVETTSEHFLNVLHAGNMSTNFYLRRAHSFAIGMHWLPWPVLPKLHWPPLSWKERRAITFEEHRKIISMERKPEMRAYFDLLWHLGGSQTDIAELTAESIDWNDHTISYRRRKTGVAVVISFGPEAASILEGLPKSGPLFPKLSRLRAGNRAHIFRQRMKTFQISGISLHSYRYAWAERARKAGYPEQYAMQALGHKSEAVHRAYAKKAKMQLPSLEEFENKIVPLPKAVNQ